MTLHAADLASSSAAARSNSRRERIAMPWNAIWYDVTAVIRRHGASGGASRDNCFLREPRPQRWRRASSLRKYGAPSLDHTSRERWSHRFAVARSPACGGGVGEGRRVAAARGARSERSRPKTNASSCCCGISLGSARSAPRAGRPPDDAAAKSLLPRITGRGRAFPPPKKSRTMIESFCLPSCLLCV